MPVQKVNGGWRWGSSGKVHPTRAGAEAEARAAYASGYRERDKNRPRRSAKDASSKKR